MIRTIYDLFDFPLSKSLLAPALIGVFISPSQAIADMNDWKHSGSMYIVTTSGGANLPASAWKRTSLCWFDSTGTLSISARRSPEARTSASPPMAIH